METALTAQADASEAPAVAEGLAALAKPLACFGCYEFVLQCPTPACGYRHAAVDPLLAARPQLSVAEILAKLRCRSCSAPPEIVGMCTPNASYGFHWLLLRGHGRRWRSDNR